MLTGGVLPDPNSDVVTGQQIVFFCCVICPGILLAAGLLSWGVFELIEWIDRKRGKK